MVVHQTCLSSSGATYFTADHHLWPGELPQTLLAFCENLKPGDAWWIMGDFFEVWLENHWSKRFDYQSLLTLLRELTTRGIEIKLLVGNRDFSAGDQLIKATGMQVDHGAWVFDSAQGKQMVIHGDELLPSDKSYQRFKKIVRSPIILWLLKCLPMSMLLKIAGKTRDHSKTKLNAIYDDKFKLDCQLIQKACESYQIAKCWAGHLHQAKTESFQLDGSSLEVEILHQSTLKHLEAIVWETPNSNPEHRVWN